MQGADRTDICLLDKLVAWIFSGTEVDGSKDNKSVGFHLLINGVLVGSQIGSFPPGRDEHKK